MWEIQNPMKTQSLPRRCSQKFGTVSVKTNYRSYRDYLQSFNESRDDQESLSSTDSGISSYKLSESKSANSSSGSVSSDLSTNSQIRKNEISSIGVKPYKEFLENYSAKKFSPVKPTLPEKKNVKSEIYIEVLGTENGRASPERLPVSKSNESASPKENGIKTNVLKIEKVNTHKLPPNGMIAEKTNPDETFKRPNGYSTGKTVETIKKFNDLSKKDQDSNGTLGKTKGRVKPDIVPERSSFINGRTSPFLVQEDIKLEHQTPKLLNGTINGGKVAITKFQTLPNDYKSSKILDNQNGPKINTKITGQNEKYSLQNGFTKFKDQTDCAVNEKLETRHRKNSLQNGSTKFSANVWQITEELNKINARLLNGNINKTTGHQNSETDKESLSSESLSSSSSNESLNHDEIQAETTFEIPAIKVDSPQDFTVLPPPPPPPPGAETSSSTSPQDFAAPPPPPPPPPMLATGAKTSSSTSPKKWDPVKTDCEQTQTSKPKETNRAAMDLAKVLREGTIKLRKTKSFGDDLENNDRRLHDEDHDSNHKPQQITIPYKPPSISIKQISVESLKNRSQPVLTSTTTPNHITNNGGRNSHNNNRENKERTPSPPKKFDVQPLKSIYNGHPNANGRVPVVNSSKLRRTMSGPQIETSASILEANAKTVIPVANRNAKIEKTDPNVKKMVYNTYRGLLGAYNPKANGIIATLPRNMVREDQGVTKQLESIALQGGLDKINGRVNPNPDND